MKISSLIDFLALSTCSSSVAVSVPFYCSWLLLALEEDTSSDSCILGLGGLRNILSFNQR
jgi:hypothetical protein